MMTVTITKTGDDDETMCDSHTYENKNELRHADGDNNNDDKDATTYCSQTNRGITDDGQWLSQTPSAGLRHPSFNHCRI